MTEQPTWISKRAVVAIHAMLLAVHGGASGFIDESLLDSALDSPKNHQAYGRSDLFELAAVYAHALTQNHPFVDGNKRVALTVSLTFLERNGWVVLAPEPEAVQMVLALSSRTADAAAFAAWLRTWAQPVRRTRGPTRTRAVAKKQRR